MFLRHWLCPEYVRILDIVHPDAHERIDNLIPALVKQAEKEFFNMGKGELEKLTHYTVA